MMDDAERDDCVRAMLAAKNMRAPDIVSEIVARVMHPPAYEFTYISDYTLDEYVVRVPAGWPWQR